MHSETRTQKRTDDGLVRCERSYHAVPADWLRLGTDAPARDGHERFVAEMVCYEYCLERDAHAAGGLAEQHTLYVAYRKPGTDERVERAYDAAVFETDAEAVETTTSTVEGDIGAHNWGTIAYAAIRPDDFATIPKTVHKGEPANFRASIVVHPDEPRIGEGQ